jgi:hypothetical protein
MTTPLCSSGLSCAKSSIDIANAAAFWPPSFENELVIDKQVEKPNAMQRKPVIVQN